MSNVVQFPILKKKGKFVREMPKLPKGYYRQHHPGAVLAISPDYTPMVLLQNGTWMYLDDLSGGKIKFWDYGR